MHSTRTFTVHHLFKLQHANTISWVKLKREGLATKHLRGAIRVSPRFLLKWKSKHEYENFFSICVKSPRAVLLLNISGQLGDSTLLSYTPLFIGTKGTQKRLYSCSTINSSSFPNDTHHQGPFVKCWRGLWKACIGHNSFPGGRGSFRSETRMVPA